MRTFRNSLAAILLTAAWATAAPTMRGNGLNFRDYLGGSSRGSSLGLIDPSRLSFSHNVQMGFSSFSGGSMMQSLYASTARYRVSDPLSLSFTLGMVGTRLNAGGAPNTFQSLIGGAALDYHPTKNVLFRLEFARSPGLYRPYSRDWSAPWSGGANPIGGEIETAR